MSDAPVFKILTPEQDAAFQAQGRFEGAPVDFEDGFIHLSAGPQVAETLARHFPATGPLVLVALDPAQMPASDLKWEVSRGGALFPHLYGTLQDHMVLWRHTLDDSRALPSGVEH